MKRLLLTLFATLWATALFAADRVEVGKIYTKNGTCILCGYVIEHEVTIAVHLAFPDGKIITVGVEPGTSPATIDKTLRRIAALELAK